MGTFILVTVALCWAAPVANGLGMLLRRFACARKAGAIIQRLAAIVFLLGLAGAAVLTEQFVRKDGGGITWGFLFIAGTPLAVYAALWYRNRNRPLRSRTRPAGTLSEPD
jgi:hypothetical protein